MNVSRVTQGPPLVALLGPGGQRIVAPASGPLRTADAAVIHEVKENTTYFIVSKPQAGTWHVQVLPGSTPVTAVKTADALAQPKIKATVTGHGHNRAIRYRIAPLPGQQVRFAEVGKGAARELGVARGNAGTLHFNPADGPGESRQIVAMVDSYGLPRANLVVAHYTAPPPATPAEPGKLKLARKGSSFQVTWARADAAARYRVRVTLSDGRSLISFVQPHQRSAVTVPGVAAKTTGRITVQAVDGDNRTGKTASAHLRSAQKHKLATPRSSPHG